jgi:predicted ATP-binding protein involved in virulence
MAFPNSADPLKEEGTVLIDELDIHLHPMWQRQIPGLLRKIFPNLQFVVATHSPFIAAGAGADAVTYRLNMQNGGIDLKRIDNLAFLSVEKILQSEAFELVSLFSQETQDRIDRYYTLRKKTRRTREEDNELQMVMPIVQQALGEPASKSSLENKVDIYLNKMLQ